MKRKLGRETSGVKKVAETSFSRGSDSYDIGAWNVVLKEDPKLKSKIFPKCMYCMEFYRQFLIDGEYLHATVGCRKDYIPTRASNSNKIIEDTNGCPLCCLCIPCKNRVDDDINESQEQIVS